MRLQKNLSDLRVLDRISARNRLRTTNITATRLSLPIEHWWLLSKPTHLVLRQEAHDLYIMAPTGEPGERPVPMYVANERGRRQNITLSSFLKRTLVIGHYQHQVVYVGKQLALQLEGAVDDRLIF